MNQINYNYLYKFNKERYEQIYKYNLKKIDELNVNEYEHAFILPAKQENNLLFGLGGVVDNKKIYIDESGIISNGRYLDGKSGLIKVFGGKYNFDDENIKKVDKEVIYLGFISNHWGHFLVDFSTRLWYLLENNTSNYEYVFVVKEHQNFEMINNIKRFFELLKIDINKIHFIKDVTKFKKIIIPQASYVTNLYYSPKYINVFETVANNVECTSNYYDRIYFSRNGWYKAKNSEIGEVILINLYRNNNFVIVSPENLSLDEQINYIRNSKIVCAIAGTIPHNMLFARENQNLVIINKTYNFNSMQKDVNLIKKLNVTYIDSYISILPVSLGDGPFCLVYNDNLKNYIIDNKFKFNEKNVCSNKYLKKSINKYIFLLRKKNSKENMKYINDKNNSAYFSPDHLIDYYSNYYMKLDSLTLREKIVCEFHDKISLIRKILYRIKDKLKM